MARAKKSETQAAAQQVAAQAVPETTTVQQEGQQAPQQGQVQVNVDYLRTTRVHIAMPCYGGMLTESTFMSFIKWANTARQLGIDWTLETMVNESFKYRDWETDRKSTRLNSSHRL